MAYRLALDHPERVEKLAVLDIIPTGEAFRRTDFRFAMGYWHWFFLAQPFDLPERLIGADPEGYFGRRRNEPPQRHPSASKMSTTARGIIRPPAAYGRPSGLFSGSNDHTLLRKNCVVMVENHWVA